MYGAASIGFFADGCSRNSGGTGSRRHASGLSAAVRLNADHSSAVARAFSATVSPRAVRSAVSSAEYISGALMKPAARSGAGMISSAGTMRSSGATSSGCSVSITAGAGDVAAQVAELRFATHDDRDVEVAVGDGADTRA